MTPDLFTYSPKRHHHRRGTATEREAAREAQRFATGHAAQVLAAFRNHGPATATEIAARLKMDLYQVRRRITDLKHAHLLLETGQHGRTESGRRELQYRAA